MRLHLLAPAAIDFSTVTGASRRDSAAYTGFWTRAVPEVSPLLDQLAPEGSSAPKCTLTHVVTSDPFNRYREIDGHSLERPVELLELELWPEHLPDSLGTPSTELARPQRASCRLYDHGIFLMEVDLDVEEQRFQHTEGLAARLDDLQRSAVVLGDAAARECHDRYLRPIVEQLRALDRKQEVVQAVTQPLHAAAGFGAGRVRWVSRSLLVDDHPLADAVVRHWLKDVGVEGSGRRTAADSVIDGAVEHVSRWLNYLFVCDPEDRLPLERGGRFDDEWEAMRLAQCYYATLDALDSRLSDLLADALGSRPRGELHALRSELEQLSRRAQLVLIERDEVSKYLTRAVRSEMDRILDGWDFDSAIERPLTNKVDICRQRLADLTSAQSARATVVTDLILLGIGITSILATALALAEFGRSTAGDPQFAAYDFGGGSLTGWFANQPADAILVVSAVTCLVLVALYLHFRRSHHR